jgi:hypothetical protein
LVWKNPAASSRHRLQSHEVSRRHTKSDESDWMCVLRLGATPIAPNCSDLCALQGRAQNRRREAKTRSVTPAHEADDRFPRDILARAAHRTRHREMSSARRPQMEKSVPQAQVYRCESPDSAVVSASLDSQVRRGKTDRGTAAEMIRALSATNHPRWTGLLPALADRSPPWPMCLSEQSSRRTMRKRTDRSPQQARPPRQVTRDHTGDVGR